MRDIETREITLLTASERVRVLRAEIKNLDAEIASLRARVEKLRESLAVYVHAHETGNSVPPHIEAAARAALEAKP